MGSSVEAEEKSMFIVSISMIVDVLGTSWLPNTAGLVDQVYERLTAAIACGLCKSARLDAHQKGKATEGQRQ